MTIREAMLQAASQLQRSPTARLDAQVLLCHVLGVSKAYLVAYDDRILTDDEQAQFLALAGRRASGEPLAYILGKQAFYDLEFAVTPQVLIPRPETEHLIEAALHFAHARDSLTAADIGTGSGAIAVTVKKHAPHAVMHAVDISPAALLVAQQNAAQHHTPIHWHTGHLAQPLQAAGIRIDLLMANLPYIRSDEVPRLAVSAHEPHLALDGGDDGLDLVRELLAQVPHVCNEGALILLEIGAEQGQAALSIAQSLQPQAAHIIPDLAGLDRIVAIQR